jgi:hypothetical protein
VAPEPKQLPNPALDTEQTFMKTMMEKLCWKERKLRYGSIYSKHKYKSLNTIFIVKFLKLLSFTDILIVLKLTTVLLKMVILLKVNEA